LVPFSSNLGIYVLLLWLVTKFSVFNAFWTTLSFFLYDRYQWGPDVAGLFGLVGIVGASMAQISGRIVDKRGPFFVITI
jgi:hypothetical protein